MNDNIGQQIATALNNLHRVQVQNQLHIQRQTDALMSIAESLREIAANQKNGDVPVIG